MNPARANTSSPFAIFCECAGWYSFALPFVAPVVAIGVILATEAHAQSNATMAFEMKVLVWTSLVQISSFLLGFAALAGLIELRRGGYWRPIIGMIGSIGVGVITFFISVAMSIRC